MLNMDFNARIVIDTSRMPWVASPSPGVWRKPLARAAAEQGHATSIVRYDPGARFARHDHPLGEEILVLSGTLSDETGDFPAGSYFRNPRGFAHSPFSDQGCTLLVKLHQMSPDETTRVHVDTRTIEWSDGPGGTKLSVLHRIADETVYLVRWPPGIEVPRHGHPGGEETFVLSGELRDEAGTYGPGTWIRNPPGSAHTPSAEIETTAWIKAGHLPA